MAVLHIRMLGKLSLDYQGVPIVLNAQRSQELLGYLLLHRQRAFARETLAGVLWGNLPACAHTAKVLRQSLWLLQTAMNTLHEGSRLPLVHIESNWMQFNPEIALWLDVEVLQQAYARCQGIPGTMLDTATLAAIHQAVELYQGELLEGCYADWCLFERERLLNMYLAMLDKLMDYYEMQQHYETGVLYGMRILQQDRARECTHRQLMRMHYKAGDRTTALRQYDRCVEALSEELDVAPAASTAALYEQIRMDTYMETGIDAYTDTYTDTYTGAHIQTEQAIEWSKHSSREHLVKLFHRLERFEASLTYLRARVDEQIRAGA